MTPRSFSFRLPEITSEQISALCERLGTTQTQLIIVAVDRLAREELRKEEDPEE